ncbi:gremlin-1a [Xyrauchen texanus]|uniref:gremlin-1a n=1 Tax=Xyrauchen texanus TaxID=154827 RepID=UPI002241FC6B|nr:gremlin-1a [Xyrauchen texanus]
MTKDAFAVTVVILWLLYNPAKSRGTGGFQGAIPHPNKYSTNETEQSPQTPQGSLRGMGPSSVVDEVLNSSQVALHVTKRRYLKLDWCKTQPLKQTIIEDGCQKRDIIISFCYGQCNSFYIPHVYQEDSVFKSCSMCKPKTFTTVTYTLVCPGQIPFTKTKRVRRVKECRCTSVDLD